AERHRADDAGVIPPGPEQAVREIGRHDHVAVDEGDPFMPGGIPAFDEVAELWIAGNSIIADQQAARQLGIGLDDAADDWYGRIVLPRRAEDHFVIGMAQPKA